MAQGVLFSVDLEGQDRLTAALFAYQQRVKDLRPFWTDVFAPKYFAEVQDAFATEGRKRNTHGQFRGGIWARLSPRYAAWKRVHYPGKKILERTGALKESVRWTGASLGASGIWESRPAYVRFGTNVSYGQYHQRGTERMPARPFMDPPDPKVYAPLLRDWILRNERLPGGK
jgi:phage gpG-like protein